MTVEEIIDEGSTPRSRRNPKAPIKLRIACLAAYCAQQGWKPSAPKKDETKSKLLKYESNLLTKHPNRKNQWDRH